MTCPPGSTATPSGTGQQTPTAEAEPVASPEAQRPVAKADVTDESFPATASAKKKTARPPGVATKPPPIEPKATPAPVEEATVPTPVQAKAAPAMQPLPAEPISPAAVPAQARPQTPPPTAAFQPAPVQEQRPHLLRPGPIPGGNGKVIQNSEHRGVGHGYSQASSLRRAVDLGLGVAARGQINRGQQWDHGNTEQFFSPL
jgi:hypothetical protein